MTKSPSPLTRIMQRGQKKAQYSPRRAALLLQFSDKDYQEIATLIARWLDEPVISSDKRVKRNR